MRNGHVMFLLVSVSNIFFLHFIFAWFFFTSTQIIWTMIILTKSYMFVMFVLKTCSLCLQTSIQINLCVLLVRTTFVRVCAFSVNFIQCFYNAIKFSNSASFFFLWGEDEFMCLLLLLFRKFLSIVSSIPNNSSSSFVLYFTIYHYGLRAMCAIHTVHVLSFADVNKMCQCDTICTLCCR